MPALLVARQIKTCINHAAPALDEKAIFLSQAALAILDRNRFDSEEISEIITQG
ncbi:MAG: hypothetical protein ACI89J_004383 [Hyphomicrobiaceae bacterium]|jgi:hypothetical protein